MWTNTQVQQKHLMLTLKASEKKRRKKSKMVPEPLNGKNVYCLYLNRAVCQQQNDVKIRADVSCFYEEKKKQAVFSLKSPSPLFPLRTLTQAGFMWTPGWLGRMEKTCLSRLGFVIQPIGHI